MKKTSYVVVLSFFFSSYIFSAEIYKWKDENGQTHFGSNPPANRDINQEKPQKIYIEKPSRNNEEYSDSLDEQEIQKIDSELIELRQLRSDTEKELINYIIACNNGNLKACEAKNLSKNYIENSLKKEAILEKNIKLIKDNIKFQLNANKNLEKLK